jgi:hypothetical protein
MLLGQVTSKAGSMSLASDMRRPTTWSVDAMTYSARVPGSGQVLATAPDETIRAGGNLSAVTLGRPGADREA